MHKNSKHRDGIAALLAKNNYHPTVDDLYERARNDFPNISLATVYRNLDQLHQMGRIARIDVPGMPARYDGNTDKHYHILCEKCGHMQDVWIDHNLEDHVDFDLAIPNYNVVGYNISFTGICNKCGGGK
ncbi:MAG: transcriptional repressor [Spirochaetota bacterium]|nr:transcriptional repressor [Spirochaetota bacterium]